jgi:hypothetical protein
MIENLCAACLCEAHYSLPKQKGSIIILDVVAMLHIVRIRILRSPFVVLSSEGMIVLSL